MDGYRWLPGGKLEQWEGFLSCAIREVKEEIGIKLNIQEIKWPFWIYKSPNIIICFWKSVERIWKEKIWEPEKCSELKRFDIQELSQDILPDHKLAIDMINKWKNFLEIWF